VAGVAHHGHHTLGHRPVAGGPPGPRDVLRTLASRAPADLHRTRSRGACRNGRFPVDVATIVDKSEANCRQIFARARKRIDEGKPRFEATRRQQQELSDRFFDAVERGELDRLVDFLAADVAFYGDGGGKGRGLPEPVFGRTRVDRLLSSFFRRYDDLGARMRRVQLNGQPGVLAFDSDGKLINVFSLDIADGTIQTIRSVINPDKLAHLGYPLSEVARTDDPKE
jgi:hypothetical protein